MGDLAYVETTEMPVRARPETVWRFFAEEERLAEWLGAGSVIPTWAGGTVRVRYPNGRPAEGEVLFASAPSRIEFTWGYPGEGSPLPPGASRIEVDLSPTLEGTLVRLSHHLPDARMRDTHDGGWRHYLERLADAAPLAERGLSPGLPARIDAFLAALSETDPAHRSALLEESVTEDCAFQDRWSLARGRAEIALYAARLQAYVPGLSIQRRGEPLLCGSVAIAETETYCGGIGLEIFQLAADGRFSRIAGLAGDPGEEVKVEIHSSVADVPRAMRLWTEVLGFSVTATFPVADRPLLVQLRRGGQRVMLAARRVGTGEPVSACVWADDVDEIYAKAAAAPDCEVVKPLRDAWWGLRQFTLADPDGNWVTVCRPAE